MCFIFIFNGFLISLDIFHKIFLLVDFKLEFMIYFDLISEGLSRSRTNVSIFDKCLIL